MTLKTEAIKPKEKEIIPMSLEEFYAMIDQSERDFNEGRYITSEELRKKVKTWHR